MKSYLHSIACAALDEHEPKPCTCQPDAPAVLAAERTEREAARAPYGRCDCRTCSPTMGGCGGAGPAAFEVTRDGKRVRLCTRCDLADDLEKVFLLKTTDLAEPFVQFDALGAFGVVGMLDEKETVR